MVHKNTFDRIADIDLLSLLCAPNCMQISQSYHVFDAAMSLVILRRNKQ